MSIKLELPVNNSIDYKKSILMYQLSKINKVIDRHLHYLFERNFELK